MKFRKIFNTIRRTQEPSEEFRTRLRESLVVYMKNNPPLPKATLVRNDKVLFPWHKALTISFAALLLLCTSAVGTVFAAQKSLPGDALYGVKLAVDQLSIAISNSPDTRIKIADRRLEEVKQVLEKQTNQNNRTETDIQNALGQYQSNLQNVIVAMNTTSSASSTVSTVQNILQKTVDNEKDLEQLLSKNENEMVVQNLKSSLQFSQQTVEVARANLKENGGETNDNSTQNDTHISASNPATSKHRSPKTILPSQISREITATSTHPVDFQNESSQNSGGTGGQKIEDLLRGQISAGTSTHQTETSPNSSSTTRTTSTPSEWQGQHGENRGSTSTTSTTLPANTFIEKQGQQQETNRTQGSVSTATSETSQTTTSTKTSTSTLTEIQHNYEGGDSTSTKETQD